MIIFGMVRKVGLKLSSQFVRTCFNIASKRGDIAIEKLTKSGQERKHQKKSRRFKDEIVLIVQDSAQDNSIQIRFFS